MKAELTIKQLYYNSSIMNFFFRTQAENTFNELFELVEESQVEVFEAIESYSDDLDEIEELFYSESIPDLCETFGLKLAENENEND